MLKESFSTEEITNNANLLNQASDLISKYSWGEDYPISPYSELSTAEYVVGVIDKGKLIGSAYVHTSASPDKKDNDNLWLGGAVVHPNYRNKGIFKKLYKQQLAYSKANKSNRKILACTDNPIVKDFFLKNNWKLLRETVDEEDGKCSVYELE